MKALGIKVLGYLHSGLFRSQFQHVGSAKSFTVLWYLSHYSMSYQHRPNNKISLDIASQRYTVETPDHLFRQPVAP